jgi:RNA polymerase sigma-70 factor (ECF subfamily)
VAPGGIKQVGFARPDGFSDERAEDLDSARLVTRVQGGDGEAFGILYKRYFDRVYGYVRVAVRDAHEAEDIAQRVFMQVFEALPGYRRTGKPFRAWLFSIARNRVIDHLRKHERVEVTDPAEIDRRREREGSEEIALNALNWIGDADLMLFIERLPAVQQQVLALHFVMGLRAAEIAKVLGRDPSDVRVLKSRALRFLRARLAAIGREPGESAAPPARRIGRQATVLRKRRFVLKRR